MYCLVPDLHPTAAVNDSGSGVEPGCPKLFSVESRHNRLQWEFLRGISNASFSTDTALPTVRWGCWKQPSSRAAEKGWRLCALEFAAQGECLLRCVTGGCQSGQPHSICGRALPEHRRIQGEKMESQLFLFAIRKNRESKSLF